MLCAYYPFFVVTVSIVCCFCGHVLIGSNFLTNFIDKMTHKFTLSTEIECSRGKNDFAFIIVHRCSVRAQFIRTQHESWAPDNVVNAWQTMYCHKRLRHIEIGMGNTYGKRVKERNEKSERRNVKETFCEMRRI